MKELTLFKETPVTKAEQAAFAAGMVQMIVSGEIDPLKADIRLKSIEEVVKAVRTNKDVQASVIDEAEKYGKTSDHHGVTITVASRATKDFSGIDHVLDSMYEELERLKAAIKAREMTVENGIDPATGETFAPIRKTHSTYLAYKFK